MPSVITGRKEKLTFPIRLSPEKHIYFISRTRELAFRNMSLIIYSTGSKKPIRQEAKDTDWVCPSFRASLNIIISGSRYNLNMGGAALSASIFPTGNNHVFVTEHPFI